jgi:hypothetical protein
MKETVTRLACCQSLLVSQINYTLTNFATIAMPSATMSAAGAYLIFGGTVPRIRLKIISRFL